MRNTMQKGFTLIELMIVVAIIGILAAIALPQYQTYVTKSQVSRVMEEAASLKTSVETCILDGKLDVGTVGGTDATKCEPSATASTLMDATPPSGDAFGTVGTNAGIPGVKMNADGTATIDVKFGNGASTALTSAAAGLKWSRDKDGGWTCTTTSVDAKYQPRGCGVAGT